MCVLLLLSHCLSLRSNGRRSHGKCAAEHYRQLVVDWPLGVLRFGHFRLYCCLSNSAYPYRCAKVSGMLETNYSLMFALRPFVLPFKPRNELTQLGRYSVWPSE